MKKRRLSNINLLIQSIGLVYTLVTKYFFCAGEIKELERRYKRKTISWRFSQFVVNVNENIKNRHQSICEKMSQQYFVSKLNNTAILQVKICKQECLKINGTLKMNKWFMILCFKQHLKLQQGTKFSHFCTPQLFSRTRVHLFSVKKIQVSIF